MVTFAHSCLESYGQMPLAKQSREVSVGAQAFFLALIEINIAAQLAITIVAYQQADRPVLRLRLHGQLGVLFLEQTTHQRG